MGEPERETTSGFPFQNPKAAADAPSREAAPQNASILDIRPEPIGHYSEEPKETPAWIWSLLGAIDPILREDGCVWSDETPQRPSYRMFCIGKPDPQQPGMIRLDSGMRLPVGTHLWEHGPVMRLNDGTQVAQIPLTSRFRSAVLEYVDGLLRHDPDPALCEGRLDPIEERGGHVLEKHVGKTEQELRKRLEMEPQIRSASTFSDERLAESAIHQAIEKEQEKIGKWLRQSKGLTLELQHEHSGDLGVVLRRNSTGAHPSKNAIVVLKRDDKGGFYVRTAYLE